MSQKHQEHVEPIKTRIATAHDIEGLTTTLTAAFAHDPLWSWAFPNLEDLAVLWKFYIGSALRYPNVWIVGDYAAASVWIPPHGSELTEEEEERMESLVRDLIGDRAAVVMELVAQFEGSHPREQPHYYLSLLGTHPDYRGQGLGMALLSENLASMDSEGVPAYLESSNPGNDRRYERLGFKRLGEFKTPGEDHTVATMWREAQALKAAGLRE
jgi:ribosomal protein S18 acetylase RimI-like enzyme